MPKGYEPEMAMGCTDTDVVWESKEQEPVHMSIIIIIFSLPITMIRILTEDI